jgi:hypothetical protein
MSDICARSVIPPQQVLVHRRQPWRNRRRRHRARAARSMVDTAPRASTSRHCATSALVPPNYDSEYWYIIGNLGAHEGGTTAHWRRHRWSTLHNAPRRVNIVKHLRAVRHSTTPSTGTSYATLAHTTAAPSCTGSESVVHCAPRRVDIVRHLRSSRRKTTASTGTP